VLWLIWFYWIWFLFYCILAISGIMFAPNRRQAMGIPFIFQLSFWALHRMQPLRRCILRKFILWCAKYWVLHFSPWQYRSGSVHASFQVPEILFWSHMRLVHNCFIISYLLWSLYSPYMILQYHLSFFLTNSFVSFARTLGTCFNYILRQYINSLSFLTSSLSK